MASIELAVEVGEDFERILQHLSAHDIADAGARVDEIIQAIDVLKHSPLIGRPASGHLRELIIGRRSRGYVALYRYVAESDMIFILAIRSQREAGYVGRQGPCNIETSAAQRFRKRPHEFADGSDLAVLRNEFEV